MRGLVWFVSVSFVLVGCVAKAAPKLVTEDGVVSCSHTVEHIVVSPEESLLIDKRHLMYARGMLGDDGMQHCWLVALSVLGSGGGTDELSVLKRFVAKANGAVTRRHYQAIRTALEQIGVMANRYQGHPIGDAALTYLLTRSRPGYSFDQEADWHVSNEEAVYPAVDVMRRSVLMALALSGTERGLLAIRKSAYSPEELQMWINVSEAMHLAWPVFLESQGFGVSSAGNVRLQTVTQ